jgi:D-3-phosphoglycerate dehydrogenase/C-terminal binding protein
MERVREVGSETGNRDRSLAHRVVVTDFLGTDLSVERAILGDLAELVAFEAADESLFDDRIRSATALMVYHTIRISEKTIRKLENCRLIVRCGVGFDNVDHAFARKAGIPVANVPDYGTEEVADSAIGLMLSMTRGITVLNSRLRSSQGPWSYSQAAPLHRLREQQFSIVGLGRIGTAAAMRAKAFGMRVAFYDPYKPDGFDKALGIRRAETLEELFEQSAVLSMHCPLTAETRHMINERSLQRIARGAYLVNTARGAVVDTSAIPNAIATGRLAGAGIDVLEHEPPDEADPLIVAWRDPNHPAHNRVIVNAHAAFYSEEGLGDMRRKGAEACRRALLGLPLRNIVND